MENNSPPDIRIIDSIDSTQTIALQEVERTFSAGQAILSHGDQFTGKPGTQIYNNDEFVVKLHTELDFKEKDAERWIERKIEQERLYGISIPSKTWFLVKLEDKSIISNITPCLVPLHLSSPHTENYIDWIQQMYRMYFQIAAEHHKLLDGGLSNFATNESGRLYYIDDDIYEWDNYTAFCNQTGVLIRQLAELTAEQWHQLGIFCHDCIIAFFKDRHQLTIAFEQLRGLFTANNEQKQALDAFIEGFYQKGNKNRSVEYLLENDALSGDSSSNKRIAIMADIHANLPALEAVLAELDRQQVTAGIILGDVIGYGPHPEECIRLLQQRKFTVVKGNHDHAIATGVFSGGFSATGRFVAEWSADVISDESRQWLDHLPPYLRHDNWLAVHGSPMDKTFFNGYVYQMTYSDNLDNLQQRDIAICFHGHSHVQGIFYRQKKQDDFSKETTQFLNNYDFSLVCPGSIGQPRGNIAGAEFAIYDTETSEIDFYRLDYDMEKTMSDMAGFNFPSQLIERLPQGK